VLVAGGSGSAVALASDVAVLAGVTVALAASAAAAVGDAAGAPLPPQAASSKVSASSSKNVGKGSARIRFIWSLAGSVDEGRASMQALPSWLVKPESGAATDGHQGAEAAEQEEPGEHDRRC
jgi:hypothetical protein